ncbi:uncharacterized protein [Drosophila bipectinata]|uniref:uncharacterized protein n=1 Tax=Drosophila bipectinata TaxID=42026 RepID=UPI0038B3FCE4
MCKLSDNPLDRQVSLLRKFIVTYREEFDEKVNFRGLQDAIDAIDKAMLGYEGVAKERLDKVRDLNSTARLTYKRCVGLIFEWSVSASETYRTLLPVIRRKGLTESERNIILNIVSESLSSGLPKIKESLKLLEKEVLVKVTELSDLFKSIEHDVHSDFGENGFYGKKKQELRNKINESHKQRTAVIFGAITGIYGLIGGLIFGPIGLGIGLAAGIAKSFKVKSLVEWQEQKDIEKQLDAIDCFFKLITEKLGEAQKVIGDVIKALEEDKKNVGALAGKCESTSKCTNMLGMEDSFIRNMFADNLAGLQILCEKYAKWHGYDPVRYAAAGN